MTTVLDISLGDTVVIINLDEKPIDLSWNSRRYSIPVGGRGHVPFDCAKEFFGDPRSGEITQKVTDEYNQTCFIPDRPYEIYRLRRYWQTSNPNEFREIIPGDRETFKDGISDRIPKIRMETMTGEHIVTVAEDPYGDSVIVAAPTRSDRESLDNMLQLLSNENREMKARLAAIERSGVIEQMPEPENAIPAGSPVTPTRATLAENPQMAYNQRTKKILQRRTPEADPTTIESLPTD